MAIPDYQTLMLPVLHRLADGNEHALRDVVAQLADQYRLTPEERRELLPSGTQPTFNNRVAWAKTYLKKAGLIGPVPTLGGPVRPWRRPFRQVEAHDRHGVDAEGAPEPRPFARRRLR